MTINNVNQGVHAGLVRIAALVISSMRDKLAHGYPSNTDLKYGWVPIAETIKLGRVQVTSAGSSIQITLGGEEAPYAAAYEWGSGIHATRGEVGVYPIAARPGTPNLVFWWEKRGKWFVGPALPIGHPGVAPKPYIKPSIDENIDEMKKIMAQEFKIAVLAGTKEVEVFHVGG